MTEHFSSHVDMGNFLRFFLLSRVFNFVPWTWTFERFSTTAGIRMSLQNAGNFESKRREVNLLKARQGRKSFNTCWWYRFGLFDCRWRHLMMLVWGIFARHSWDRCVLLRYLGVLGIVMVVIVIEVLEIKRSNSFGFARWHFDSARHFPHGLLCWFWTFHFELRSLDDTFRHWAASDVRRAITLDWNIIVWIVWWNLLVDWVSLRSHANCLWTFIVLIVETSRSVDDDSWKTTVHWHVMRLFEQLWLSGWKTRSCLCHANVVRLDDLRLDRNEVRLDDLWLVAVQNFKCWKRIVVRLSLVRDWAVEGILEPIKHIVLHFIVELFNLFHVEALSRSHLEVSRWTSCWLRLWRRILFIDQVVASDKIHRRHVTVQLEFEIRFDVAWNVCVLWLDHVFSFILAHILELIGIAGANVWGIVEIKGAVGASGTVEAACIEMSEIGAWEAVALCFKQLKITWQRCGLAFSSLRLRPFVFSEHVLEEIPLLLHHFAFWGRVGALQAWAIGILARSGRQRRRRHAWLRLIQFHFFIDRRTTAKLGSKIRTWNIDETCMTRDGPITNLFDGSTISS